MNSLSLRPSDHSDSLQRSESQELQKLPDTRKLAAAVAKFRTGNYGKPPNTFSVSRSPASSIGPEYVDFHLEHADNKIIIVVGCPGSGPEVARIVLWKDIAWDVALQTSLGNYQPHNHGMTQMQIDSMTAFIEQLRTSPDQTISDVTKIGKGARESIAKSAPILLGMDANNGTL